MIFYTTGSIALYRKIPYNTTVMNKYETKSKLILHFLYGAKRFFALSLTFAALVSLFDMINPKIISFTVDSVI